MNQRRRHWDTLYLTKRPSELSWTQPVPKTSLQFIHSLSPLTDARIIDIGGGDSRLVDYLLDEGFRDLTVLDISEESLRRAKDRLGDKATRVRWVVRDVNDFVPDTLYDLWHDRATFHFLTSAASINKYVSIARLAVKPGGGLIVGTFSTAGPRSCSGLPVHQYDEASLEAVMLKGFQKIRCITEDHTTPFETTQNFLFCSFRRRQV